MIYLTLVTIAFLFLISLGYKAKRRADFYKSKPITRKNFPFTERVRVAIKQRRAKRNSKLKPESSFFIGPYTSALRSSGASKQNTTLPPLDFCLSDGIGVEEIGKGLTGDALKQELRAKLPQLKVEHRALISGLLGARIKERDELSKNLEAQEQRILDQGFPLPC